MKFFKSIRGNNRGFTLIEVLIVIGVMAAVTAIIIPNISGLVGSGKPEAAKAELVDVQTAMDAMMAKSGISSVTATAATNDMGAFPTRNPLYPDYLPSAHTTGKYSCTGAGLVTQVTTGY